jgi:predicted metalloprotease with PDZ domain
VTRRSSGESLLIDHHLLKLGYLSSRVFISDVTKHSPAAVCGLRDSDRIIEINGSSIETLTYETILDKIKQHMARDDLELLVLDKKSVHWYRERNYPITSRTLPTIVHIEPIINDPNNETQFSDVPMTNTKMVGFAGRSFDTRLSSLM